MKRDINIVRVAIEQNPLALEYATEFQDHKKLVLEAVSKDGMALQFASLLLRNDFDVVLNAVKNDKSSLQFASPELQKNEVIRMVIT